jgi:hypothetical protein
MTTKELRALVGVTSLLSSHNSNPKVAKAEKKLGVRTAVLHLAPHKMSGFNVCSDASPGCIKACLHHAGAALYQNGKDRARVARTQFFFKYRELFLAQLAKELTKHVAKAKAEGLKPAVRLNGTSDLPWERIKDAEGKTIIDRFPEVQFYDYTAVLSRLKTSLPSNYHLTFSLKENNLAAALEAKALGYNIAAVFVQSLPEQLFGRNVIDGDEHDYRPADPSNVIVGLKAKGSKGKNDLSGFVIGYEPLKEAA